MPFGHQLDVKHAGIGRGAVNGVIQIEHLGRPRRANLRKRRRATLMLRVSSSMVSS